MVAAVLGPLLRTPMRRLGMLSEAAFYWTCAACCAVLCAPAAAAAVRFTAESRARVGLVLFWTGQLALALFLLAALAPGSGRNGGSRRRSRGSGLLTVLRKGFHLLALGLLLPGLLLDPAFLSLALAVAMCALVALELTRLFGPRALARPIHKYMSQFADARDR